MNFAARQVQFAAPRIGLPRPFFRGAERYGKCKSIKQAAKGAEAGFRLDS